MVSPKDFLEKIIVQILNLPKVDEKYEPVYSASCKNILSYYFSGKAKTIGDDCKVFLEKLIPREIKQKPGTDLLIFNYLISILPGSDKKLFNDVSSLDNLIFFVLKKFNDGNNYELIDYDNSEWKNKEFYAEKVKDIYVSATESVYNNQKIFYIFAEKLVKTILNHIKTLEKIDISNKEVVSFLSQKQIVRKSIIMSINNVIEESKYLEYCKSKEEIADTIDICFLNLKKITNWYLNEYLNSSIYRIESDSIKSNKKFRVRAVHIDEYLKLGHSIEEYIIECFNMWDDTLELKLPENHKGSVKQWIPIIKENIDNQRLLLNDKNEFVGFWDFEPLFDKQFNRLKDGKFLDSEMSVNIIPTMMGSGIYNIYMMNILLKESYRNNLSFETLFSSMINYIEELALGNKYINEVCAWAYTDKGISICETIGLKYHKDHIEHGRIYIENIKNILNRPICRDFKTLKRRYAQIEF